MRKCNANEYDGVLDIARRAKMTKGKVARTRIEYGAYIGLDVHKDTIAVAVAYPGREEAQDRGDIANTPKALRKLIQRLSPDGEVMTFCYEAGPCGYGIYRQIVASGHGCEVVAPSLIPKKAGDRIKTDRRDARKLARLHRSGDLTAVWVPQEEQEAMRDLTRAREDMKGLELKARQKLGAFVLRHGHSYPGNKTRWTQAHFEWLESLKFEHSWQQIVLQEYINAVKEAQVRVVGLTEQMIQALPCWSLAPVVENLMALRGIDVVAAMTLMAELGDISRFDSPRQLMAFLGLVPSEHSSGKRKRKGAITLTGNGHARRMLIESAWSYRFPARQTKHLKRKAKKASEPVKAIAWKAQRRLCGRYRILSQAGKNSKLVITAIARELAGFVWAVVCEVMPQVNAAKAA